MTNLYEIPVHRADKSEITLDQYRGQVLLLVNVASECGLTYQYDGLEKIHERFASQGFSVLGFPSNQFGHQEPGTDAQIQEFCRTQFGVKFPVFAKLDVKGPGQHPLYAFLTKALSAPSTSRSGVRTLLRKLSHGKSFTGEPEEIGWNFEKFLVSRTGEVVARIPPDVKPEDPSITSAIEAELAKAAVPA